MGTMKGHMTYKTIKNSGIAVAAAGAVLATTILLPHNITRAESTEFQVGVTETPGLTVSLTDPSTGAAATTRAITVTPTMATAAFNEIGLDVTVGTKSPGGFNLTMMVSDNKLRDASTGAVIESLAADSTGHANGYTCTIATGADCDFTVNRWGYRVASATSAFSTPTNYLPVSNDATLINSYTAGATDGVTHSLYFGSRVNSTQQSGNYSTTINFIATATPAITGYMQDATATTLAASMPNVGDIAYIYDSRDDKPYIIGKLKDGKYWMLENLALDKTTLKSGVTLDSSNTHLAAGKTFTLPDSTTTGFANDNTGYTKAAVNTATKNNTQPLAVGQSGTGKIGVYYNYCAASAGTYCMDSSSGSGNATSDICPKGWRLPTGGASGEFQALRNQYSSAGEYALALRTPLSGYFGDGSANYQGSYGYFWSSTFYTATNMYDLNVNTTGVAPQNGNYRFGGFSVRCVFGG